MNFFKIINNQLISGSGSKLPDDSYRTDWEVLATKEDGSYYNYYNADGTPDLSKEQALTLEKALQQANTNYEEQVKALTAGIPDSEMMTWTKQETEARAYLADATVATPLIDSLVQARGVDKDVLVSKIIAKADLYAVAVGTLTGTRQKAEDELQG